MNLTLTNTGAVAVPVASTDEGGWVDALEPNVGYEVNRPNTSVIIIGNKPDVQEQLQQAASIMSELAKKLLTAIAGRKENVGDTPIVAETVSVDIRNNSSSDAVRVILGDGVTDVTVQHGAIQNCTAPGYLELRELGQAPQQGGTPD